MKTSELTGLALDWAVARANGHIDDETIIRRLEPDEDGWCIAYSTDWAQGGPIIEREDICINRDDSSREWSAHRVGDEFGAYWGPTPLIAAMRAYVSSKLGQHIDIPQKLLA
jgi:hypothetical protein